MRRLVLASLALPMLVPLSSSHAAAPCRVDLETRNSWHPVTTTGVVASADADRCSLLRVTGTGTEASRDGGATWKHVGEAPAAAAELVTANLPARQAVLVGATGGVWTTRDWGASWVAASGLADRVRHVLTDDQTPTRMFAIAYAASPSLPVTLPASSNSTLLVSTDSGRSFSAAQAATGLNVSAFAVDAAVPSRWWLGLGGKAGGLFVSQDAGLTLTRVAGGDVRAIATSRLAGGGSEMLAATDAGVLVSRDAGSTAATRLANASVEDLALEWEHPSAALLLSGGVLRTSDTASTSRAQGQGLPADCRPAALRRDRSTPSVFLVGCGDGSTWRYRSDGTDLSSTDNPDATTAGPLPGLGQLTSTPMKELARRRLPNPGTRVDGSLAFDGQILYYTDRGAAHVVHRMLARTGAALPDLVTGVPRGMGHVAYDANRDQLLVLDRALVVWAVDLKTGKTTKLFHSPLSGQSEQQDADNDTFFYGSMTFDSATDRILFANDQSDGFTEYDRSGRQTHACPSLGLPTLITVNGTSGTGKRASIAGLVATGDGLVYVEAEDDSSVVRVDRSCHVLAEFRHDSFSEAPNENDALACDTTSFAEPAVWMRDASAGVAVAYTLDKGYCALPSALTVSAPPGVAQGQAGTVCAHLVARAKGLPIGGLPVDLLVADRSIGSPVTDARGVACAAYHPLPNEAGAGTGTTSTRQPVLAAFLGTNAYRPSDARASLVVSRVVAVPFPPVPPVQVRPQPVVLAPIPPPPVQPPPPPPNVPQQQPITQPQGHPGAQPGAMGQIGAAPMSEDEAQAQAQGADMHQMSALSWEAYPLPVVLALAMGMTASRRRRASRVRSQAA